MRIKNQLVSLVAGVALPLVMLAGFVTSQLWQQAHKAFEQQYLERASAVRLALDTEFDVIVRTLRAVGDGAEIQAGDTETVLLRRFRRLLENYPNWASVTLTDAQGRVLMTHARTGQQALPLLDIQGIRDAMSSRSGFISNVAATVDGRHFVFVATGITSSDGPPRVMYATIEHAHWLRMLGAYPVSKRGTLTLMDRSSKVITRTLDDQRWVGKNAPAEFWTRIAGESSGAFKAVALDGTLFYVAFSRSATSGWVLSTGVPEQEVDEALYWKTLAVVLVAVVAILGALFAAWRLGKAINAALTGLRAAAEGMGGKMSKDVRLPIREARAVHEALINADEELLAREESLNTALEREASARRQAETASRAKDQLLAMMGHELRNPVSAIVAAVGVLDTDAAAGTPISRSQEIVRRQAAHLAGMITNLIDVVQLNSDDIVLQKTQLDLAQVTAKVLMRFEETGRCTHLQMRTEHVPAWIEADEARIELLITCLLDNACKYTPAGGTVTMVVSGQGNSSTLVIRDTGSGIDADLAGRIFEPFSQGHRSIERSQGGLGLGLALAHKLVSLHGGTIAASSDGPGRGATFTVTFPSAQPLVAPSTPKASDDLLITIVEDIPDNREALMLLLEAQGRRINAAADGPSGVELVLEGPSDVALVDIGLPGFDGHEVARRVRKGPGGSRVLLIALTGYGTDADRTKAFNSGFDDFLVKPFDPDSFEATLAKGLDRKRDGQALLPSG